MLHLFVMKTENGKFQAVQAHIGTKWAYDPHTMREKMVTEYSILAVLGEENFPSPKTALEYAKELPPPPWEKENPCVHETLLPADTPNYEFSS